MICNYIENDKCNFKLLERLKNRTAEEKLPNKADVEGGAHGLIRLYSQYRWEKAIVFHIFNHQQHINSFNFCEPYF